MYNFLIIKDIYSNLCTCSTKSKNSKSFNKKRKSIKQQSKQQGIIIAKAYRADTAVIMNVKDYIKEAEQQLSKVNNYLKLQEDPTTISIILGGNTTERLKNGNKQQKHFLRVWKKTIQKH